MDELFKAWSDTQQNLWKVWLPSTATTNNREYLEDRTTPLTGAFNELHEIWKESLEKFATLAQQAGDVSTFTPQALHEMFAPAKWSGKGIETLDAGLRQFVEGPKLAALWEMDRKLVELRQLSSQRSQDVAAFQSVVQGAWSRAYDRFTKEYLDSNSNHKLYPKSWRELTNRWLSVVDDVLVETYRSDAFIEAQRRLLRSASDHRLKEQEIAQAFCEANHIPTRHEIDEMQRTVAELRRQVRSLNRFISATKTSPSLKPETSGPTLRKISDD